MDSYSVEFKYIDPNGYGIISTWVYKGRNLDIAKNKAEKGFHKYLEKMYGFNLGDVEIIRTETKLIKTGLFSERSWKNC